MEQKAISMLSLSSDMKRQREEVSILKDGLITHMKESDTKSITVGDHAISLVERKSKGAVGLKKLLSLAKETLGDEAAQKLATAAEGARGDMKIRYGLKVSEV